MRYLILPLHSSAAQKITASSLEGSYLRSRKDSVLIYTVSVDTKVFYQLVLGMPHFVGARKPAISLAHLDIDKPAPTNQLIITKFAM
jgi:hypothetical protein